MYVHVYHTSYFIEPIFRMLCKIYHSWQACAFRLPHVSPFTLPFIYLKVSHFLFFFSFLFFSFLLFPCSNDKQLTHGQLHTFERLSFLLFSKPYIPWSFHPLSWFIFRLIITRLVFHEPTLDHFNIYTTFCKSWINVFSNFYNTSTEFKIV